MSDWSAWVGRETNATDTLTPTAANRWLATFDRDLPNDGIMPQGVHFCLCTPDVATDTLGVDGHPARSAGSDGFLPPIPLPRRMWAASTIEFISPIAIGAAIERTSRIGSVSEKEGKSGSLAFVEIELLTMADGCEAVREQQTLVYRDAAAANATLAPPPPKNARFDKSGWPVTRVITPSTALLFRYSALTFNTHRIHYDAPYARGVERYRGLVVHGPLIASLLLQLAAKELGENAVGQFTFRAISPAIAGELLFLAMRPAENDIDGGYELGAFAQDGRQTMTASVVAR
ncbi:MAG: hypothetical protein WA908_12125 [Pontixanthobacter sp.]